MSYALMLLSLNQHRLFRLGAFRIISGWDHFSVHHPTTCNEKILLNMKIILPKDPLWTIPQTLTIFINSFLSAWKGLRETQSSHGLSRNTQPLWIRSHSPGTPLALHSHLEPHYLSFHLRSCFSAVCKFSCRCWTWHAIKPFKTSFHYVWVVLFMLVLSFHFIKNKFCCFCSQWFLLASLAKWQVPCPKWGRPSVMKLPCHSFIFSHHHWLVSLLYG